MVTQHPLPTPNISNGAVYGPSVKTKVLRCYLMKLTLFPKIEQIMQNSTWEIDAQLVIPGETVVTASIYGQAVLRFSPMKLH